MIEDSDVPLTEILAEVRRIEVQSRRLVTDWMSGGYASVFRGSGVEFEEVREYVDGDDPRSVDWNVTARVGRPYVKKFVDERQLSVLFLLDVSRSMSGGFGAWSARQTAARVCACLALSAVRNNDRVGLIAFASEVEKFVPLKRGQAQVLRIVRDCLALPSRPGPTRIESALEAATKLVRRRAVVVILSDFLAEDFDRPLRLCAQRHDVVAVRLLLPEMRPLPELLLRLRDPESNREVVIDGVALGRRHDVDSSFTDWKKRSDDSLRRAGVDTIDVAIPDQPDADAVGRPLRAFFEMRERRSIDR